VAVVSLLKEAGASSKLTILIIGESLMNDGTAMVLFMLFYNMLEGSTYDTLGIIEFFISMSLGSCLLGASMGLLTVRFLRSLNRPLIPEDTVLQISVTFCCAYLSFYTAQSYLEISGVLCCCGAGVVLAWLGPPIILNHESMHNVWAVVEWFGNTMIFLLAGLIFGTRTLESVDSIDWLYLFVLYVFLHLVRLLIVVVCYPFLRKLGHPVSMYDAVFIVWAGLRGALGIVLGLIVEVNT
jgi:NhaP-type Na+/H+ or K+/H+ antiporter